MKVLIITSDAFPNGMASVNRIKCYAKALISAGVECKVLVYTRTERYGVKAKNIEGQGIADGIPFEYMGGTPLRASNVFIRQVNDRLDKWKLLRYLNEYLDNGDVVYSYGGSSDYLPYVSKVVHRHGALLFSELCELPYGTGAETASAVRNRQKMLLRCFPLLDGTICISDALLDLAKHYTASGCKNVKVPILVDFERYDQSDKSSEADFPYIFHSGTLYEQKDGILGMIEAFGKALQMTDVQLKFISTGKLDNSPHAAEIKALTSKYNLEGKLIFTGYLSNEELRDYLAKATMVIINKYPTQQNKYCFSTKLGEYLASEKPVIITNVGEAMNWLEHNQSAYVIDHSDTDQLRDAIVRLAEDEELRRKLSKNGKDVCRKSFDYKSYGAFLKELFTSI